LKKIEKSFEPPVQKKFRFDDIEYVKDHEKNLEDVKEAVQKGIVLYYIFPLK